MPTAKVSFIFPLVQIKVSYFVVRICNVAEQLLAFLIAYLSL